MRLLFVPYKSSKDVGEAPEASPHKHAAMEHHRKARLLKKAVKNSSTLQDKGPEEQDAIKRKQKSALAKQDGKPTLLVWKNDADERIRQPKPRTILGAGRVDPFNAYCVFDQPFTTHEMVDHGASDPSPISDSSIGVLKRT